jgi:hypothetical protein
MATDLNVQHDDGCAWITARNTCDCSRGAVLRDLDVVAQQVIRRWVEYATDWDDGWDDFPDLGEHTWQDVLTVARRLTERPDPEEFAAAYQRLAAMADAEAS